MFVLTRSNKRKDNEQAIVNHMVLDVPTNEVLDTMEQAFANANRHHGNEQKFFVGKKGTTSFMIEGTHDSVGGPAEQAARAYLDTVRHDTPASTVHTHRDSLEGLNDSLLEPSCTDISDANFKDRLQASIILSYEKAADHSGNQKQGLNVQPYSFYSDRRILFYYKKIKPLKIPYGEFIKAVHRARKIQLDQHAAAPPAGRSQ